MDRFTSWLEKAVGDAETLFARITDKKQFARVVTASYLIARADGDFDASEKSALCKLVNQKLPQFKMDDILGVLDSCEEKMSFDETMGTQELMHDISKASDSDAAQIMQAACFIGAADGDFDDDEKDVARRLAATMNVKCEAYGL